MPRPTPEGTLRAAALCAALLTLPALADPRIEPVARTQPEPLDITGRNFAGLRLPVAPTEVGSLDATFGAARVWAWSEPPGDTGVPPVQRLLLSGDVHMTLGIYELTAARALVWLQRLDPGDVGGREGLAQVYIYFDRVATPQASAEASGPISFNADRLSIEGVFRVSGSDILRTDDLKPVRPPDDRFMLEGEQSLARRLRRLMAAEPEPIAAGVPQAPPGTEPIGPIPPDESRPYLIDPDARALAHAQDLTENLAIPQPLEPIFAKEGVFTIAPGEIVGIEGDPDTNDATVVMVTGGIVVQYHDIRQNKNLQINAERAVIYLSPQADRNKLRFSTPDILGIYLEGDVMASDGRYTLRSPRMYYDVQFGRALVLDAVFWTYDPTLQMPLYVRAKTIRQESRQQFAARSATISNTGFFEPHFSVGATSVTIKHSDDTDSGWLADARNITINAGSIPFFYWPIFRGDPRNIPLRAIEFVGSSVSGAGIRTAWDLPTLLGIHDPRGVSAELLLDAYFDRGFGIGTDLRWTKPDSLGAAYLYMLPNDNGTDSLSGGNHVKHDGDFRGIAVVEHQWHASDAWTLFLEGSSISDVTFIDAFLPQWGYARREFRNSALMRWLEGNAEATAQLKGSIDDFTPNQHLLQSQGYVVDRLPELTYTRVGDDLLSSASPGLLTYFSESSIGQVAFHFTDKTPADFGFDRPGQSRTVFGLDPDDNIADALRAEGLSEKPVTRFDTRHELTLPLEYAAMNITPFAVGRVTAYDQDFESFSGNDDQARLWGETGVRVASTFQRIDDSVRSRMFDVNRIRHIVTPSATASVAGTNIDEGELPVYDDGVEDINEGSQLRLALEQTWQTKRGGPGRERTVDWFTLDSELVFSSGDDSAENPYPRYFGYRPELSEQGDYFGVTSTWQVSEVFGITASTAYDLNTSQQTRSAAGMILRHSQDFSTFVDLLYSNPHDQTFLSFGAAYALSDKYNVVGRATYDQNSGDLQVINTSITRLYPNMRLGLGIDYNNIRGETSFSFILQPLGIGQRGATFRGIGASNPNAQRSSFGG